jgi:hypothetical protein
VRDHYPDFLPTFDAYSYNIQRADAIRYLVLHNLGGVYVDLDYECLRPLEPLLAEHTFVIGLEPAQHASECGEDRLLCNALMASVPGHTFLECVIQHLRRQDPRALTHRDVLKSTGPIMLTQVYRAYRGNDVTVLPSNVLCPIGNDKIELGRLQGDSPAALARKQDLIARGGYAIHYWNNGWCGNLAGELINPHPYDIDGFEFFSGLDSFGYDLVNKGRDVRQLAAWCQNDPGAVAFNTDGFLKAYVRPRRQWTQIGQKGGNEGLYIKRQYLRRPRFLHWLIGISPVR